MQFPFIFITDYKPSVRKKKKDVTHEENANNTVNKNDNSSIKEIKVVIKM
jgi:hypothetical protein